MDFEQTEFIQDVRTLEDEDGNAVDAIILADKRVLAIDGETVVLYDSLGQLQESLSPDLDRPHIDLG